MNPHLIHRVVMRWMVLATVLIIFCHTLLGAGIEENPPQVPEECHQSDRWLTLFSHLFRNTTSLKLQWTKGGFIFFSKLGIRLAHHFCLCPGCEHHGEPPTCGYLQRPNGRILCCVHTTGKYLNRILVCFPFRKKTKQNKKCMLVGKNTHSRKCIHGWLFFLW